MNRKLICRFKGMAVVALLALAWLGMCAPDVSAYSSFLNTFNTRYGTSSTRLNTCGVCHLDPGGGGPFNPYGTAFDNLVLAGQMAATALANIESQDSDGDGYTNIVEINARTFPGNAADHPVATAPVMGLSPTTRNFGSVAVGSSSNVSVTISNTGNGALTVSNIVLSGSLDFSLVSAPATPLTVAAGATAVLTVRYTPSGTGSDAGALTVSGNDSAHAQLSATLAGNGVASAITATPMALDFGALTTGNSKSLVLTIGNSGSLAGTVKSMTIAGSTAFALASSAPSTPFMVSTGSTVSVSVVYTPTSAGAASGTLQLATDSPSTPTITVTLSGSASAPPTVANLTVAPLSVAFGLVPVGAASNAVVILGNTGNTNCTVSGLSISGADFALGAASPATPFSVAPGATVTVPVAYSPTTAAAASGSLQIASNDPDQPLITVALGGTGAASKLAVAPGALDFSTVAVGSSATRTATISNSGNLDATVSSLSVSGSGFALATGAPTTPVKVAAGASVNVSVVYAPSAASSDSGQLQVASDAANAPLITVALSGTGTVAPAVGVISVTPASLAYGNVAVATNKTMTATIHNGGTGTLNVSALTLSNAKFTTSVTAPLAIAPGASADVAVVYTPVVVAVDSGSLEIASDDPSNPTESVAPSGAGVQSKVTASATSLAFGQVTVGTSKTMTIKLTNSGGASAVVSGLSVSGGAGFALNSAAAAVPFTLAAGASVDVPVDFTPGDTSSQTGTLLIASNDPANPQISVALSGIGVQQPSAIVNLNINRLSVTSAITRPGQLVRVTLYVLNKGKVDQQRPATIVGVQNGVEVYRQTQLVSARVHRPPAANVFPAYAPTVSGTITWTATIADDSPDNDRAVARTLVRFPVHHEVEDEGERD